MQHCCCPPERAWLEDGVVEMVHAVGPSDDGTVPRVVRAAGGVSACVHEGGREWVSAWVRAIQHGCVHGVSEQGARELEPSCRV